MKLCKDCKYLGRSPFGNLTYCERPTGEINIFGEEETVSSYCKSERYSGWINSRLFKSCGKEGRYFETKEEEHD